MNNIQIMGRLTRDPDIRETQSGIKVANFTLAVDRPFAKKDENGKKPADFISVVAWRNTGDFVSKYFVRGQRVAVTGHLQTRNYVDKDDIKRYVTEVVAQNVFFADSKKDNKNNNSTSDTPAFTDNLTNVDDEPLPF